jgi:hypothetical protein
LEYLRPYLINREKEGCFLFKHSYDLEEKTIIVQEIEVHKLENMNLVF